LSVELIIHCEQEKLINELKLFILLKLLYTPGYLILNKSLTNFLMYALDIKSKKTFIKRIKTIENLEWIITKNSSQSIILVSIDKIRSNMMLESRVSIPVNIYSLNNMMALTGAAIFGYLHKDFWRKVKREKTVLLKRRTYLFPTLNFNYKEKPAPVSIYGVRKIFDIEISRASRLKKAAQKLGYIKIQKDFSDFTVNKQFVSKHLSNEGYKQNIVYHNGNHHLQLIDHILPLFHFKRRNKIQP